MRRLVAAGAALVVLTGCDPSAVVADVVKALGAGSPPLPSRPAEVLLPPPDTLPEPAVVDGVGPVASGSGISIDVAATLACIRSHEQGADGYATETGNGYSGGYQFSASTYRGAVARAGYPEWAERPASEAPAYVQDAAAAQLLSERGLAPWPPAAGCAA